MPIEQDLTRIATALEVIANNIAAVGQSMGAELKNSKSMPAANAGTGAAPNPHAAPAADPAVDTRSPQQKAADTRKANKAKKDAEAKSNVTPIAGATSPAVAGAPHIANPPPVAGPPVTPPPPAIAGELVDPPMDFTAIKELTNQTYSQLEQIEVGKGLREVGALMATTYGVETISAMAAEHYEAFARDLRALVGPAA